MQRRYRITVLLIAALVIAVSPPPNTKILFPSQDDLNDFTGSANGCDLPGQLLQPIEQYVASHAPDAYVRYDIAPLNRRGVRGLEYVYSRAACRRLRRYFPEVNVFVMARVRLLRCGPAPAYDVEAKVYSLRSGKETVIFSQRNVARADVPKLLRGREPELFRLICDAARDSR